MVRTTTNRRRRSRRRDETGTFEEREPAFEDVAVLLGERFVLAMTCAEDEVTEEEAHSLFASKGLGERSVQRGTP